MLFRDGEPPGRPGSRMEEGPLALWGVSLRSWEQEPGEKERPELPGSEGSPAFRQWVQGINGPVLVNFKMQSSKSHRLLSDRVGGPWPERNLGVWLFSPLLRREKVFVKEGCQETALPGDIKLPKRTWHFCRFEIYWTRECSFPLLPCFLVTRLFILQGQGLYSMCSHGLRKATQW